MPGSQGSGSCHSGHNERALLHSPSSLIHDKNDLVLPPKALRRGSTTPTMQRGTLRPIGLSAARVGQPVY